MKGMFIRASLFVGLVGMVSMPAIGGHYGGHKHAMSSEKSCGHKMKHHGHAYGHPHHGKYSKHYRNSGHYRNHAWKHPHSGKMYKPGYSQPGAQYQPMTPQPYAEQRPSADIAKAQPADVMPDPAAMTVVETAVATDGFSTLVTAVKAAGLVETLNAEGPFTVFAPTDDAFAKLPEGAVPGLLNNADALTSVLTYHVVPGRITAADLLERRELETVNGATLKLDQLAVAKANIEASNGLIHVIEEVLMPPSS